MATKRVMGIKALNPVFMMLSLLGKVASQEEQRGPPHPDDSLGGITNT
jgi:hypothetical protein